MRYLVLMAMLGGCSAGGVPLTVDLPPVLAVNDMSRPAVGDMAMPVADMVDVPAPKELKCESMIETPCLPPGSLATGPCQCCSGSGFSTVDGAAIYCAG